MTPDSGGALIHLLTFVKALPAGSASDDVKAFLHLGTLSRDCNHTHRNFGFASI